MSTPTRSKNCFVIMPFGKKLIRDGLVIDTVDGDDAAEPAGGKIVDFEHIYRFLIENTIKGMNINCIKANRIPRAGWIHFEMFHQIKDSDVAIVDITALNPNVFYELGIRHALAKHATILIRQGGTRIPFNISGLNVIEYPDDLSNEQRVRHARQQIRQFVQHGLNSPHVDSPIHSVLKLRIGEEAKRIADQETFCFEPPRLAGRQICLITGDLRHVRTIDAWVSSENTNMEMSRHYERSISAVIRYFGAKRDPTGQVVDDVVANELARQVGPNAHVVPGTVVATGAGELARTHNVKKIFHAAAVVGHVGEGYRAIPNIELCVHNALEKADDTQNEADPVRSILFPLMGTGQGGGTLDEIAAKLFRAAISYLRSNPGSKLQQVYFLVWSEQELETCRRILHEMSQPSAAH
jgi:O-acetyl-ADP-ribose deacetylase (regulator of RNase III)